MVARVGLGGLAVLGFIIGGCGGTNDLGECASGVSCGTGCCTNSTEVCVTDPSTGGPGCVPSCTRQGDCATGCCAPVGDGSGNLVGPYVCQATNVCCYVAVCPGTSCCVTDTNTNEFCAQPCTGEAQCGGASVCEPFSFAHTTCTGPMACGPPGA